MWYTGARFRERKMDALGPTMHRQEKNCDYHAFVQTHFMYHDRALVTRLAGRIGWVCEPNHTSRNGSKHAPGSGNQRSHARARGDVNAEPYRTGWTQSHL